MPRRRSYTFHGGGITIEEFDEPEVGEGEENGFEVGEGGETEEEDTDEEEETDEEEGTDEEDEEEDERLTREIIDVVDSPRVSQKESEVKENQTKSQSVCSTSGSQENGEWKFGETEGLFCLICMEVWTNGGEHQVCCLPCGHLYGFSCIKKWLQQRRSVGKCPQCNRKCSLKDVRKIYASRIVAVDDEAQKRIAFLEAKLSSVEQKTASWSNKEAQWRKVEAELRSEVNKLNKKIANMESMTMSAHRQSNVASQEQYIPDIFLNSCTRMPAGHKIYQQHHGHTSCSFKHQGELLVNGGRIFDIDGGRQILLLARRLSGVGGNFVLTQMSLHSSSETDDILLPPTTRAIKDLHLSPHNNGLAVFGSLGKKLCVISLESHNTVLSYDLPAAPWSCSWDLYSSHHIYAGLQNGMVLVFDMRQTTGPFASINGLTTNPVHTIHPLSSSSTPTSDFSGLLSASSIGLCKWNITGSLESPSLVSETGNPGVCISSSYCPRSDLIVASYRPRAGFSDDTALTQTQPSLTQTGVSNCNSVDGFHVCLKRGGAVSYFKKVSSTQASVDTIRLPRTAIIDFGDERNQLFASCNESTRELILQDLSSFAVSQRFLLSSHHPLPDVKYARLSNGSGLLGLLTDDRLQLLRN